jgi:tetratricopeptide (TPR) repeat protein
MARGEMAENRNGVSPRKKKRRNNKWTLTIIAIVLAIVIVGIAVYLLYDHFFVSANDNYESQMSIGAQQLKLGDADKALEAYERALGFRPGDEDATLAVAELYIQKERYEEAAEIYEARLAKDEANTETIDILIGLYAKHLNAVDKANELIIRAYQQKLTLSSELVQPPPEFSPGGGTFNQATDIKITAPEGYEIRYVTKKGQIPAADSKLYKKAISIGKNGSKRIIAAVFDKDGLMGWPVQNIYKVAIQVAVDNSAISNLGRSAKSIMNSVGPLYYSGGMEGGYYYNDKNDKFYYIFPMNAFVDKKTGEDLDPLSTALPQSTRCVAISMKVGSYIVSPTGSIGVDDFMAGLEIEEYEVRASNSDHKYHLIYDADGARYDIALPSEDKIGTNEVMIIYQL